MAQYIPGSSVTLSAATKALERQAPNDDSELQTRLPQICVDYLSHDWEEQDVWASWRNMTRHKNEIKDGTRLENASWRTWWKQRNKLKTVSPETLNWLKDSDVTWLYGPLHTAADPIPPPKVATLSDKLNLEPDSLKGTKQRPVPERHASQQTIRRPVKPTKPILKQRTMSEVLRSYSNVHLGINSDGESVKDVSVDSDGGEYLSHDEVNGPGSAYGNIRPKLTHAKSDSATTTLRNRHGGVRGHSPGSAIHFGSVAGADSSPGSTSGTSLHGTDGTARQSVAGQPTNGKKHISFNTFVEQCVAYPPEHGNPKRRDLFIDHVGGMRTYDVDMMDEDEYDYAWMQSQEKERENGYAQDNEDEGDYLMFKTKPRDYVQPSSSSSTSASSSPSAITPLGPPGAAGRPGPPARADSTSSNASQPQLTIRKIPPTILKSSGVYPSPSPALVCVVPPGAITEGFGDAQTGPLSPGYISQGYDDLPIHRTERDRENELRGARTAWKGRRPGTPGPGSGSGTYGTIEEDESETDDAMHIDYFSVRPPTPRYAHERADYGVGQEYDVAGSASRSSRGRQPPPVATSPAAVVVASPGVHRRHSGSNGSGRARSGSAGLPATPVSPRVGPSSKSILKDRVAGPSDRRSGRSGGSGSPAPVAGEAPRGRSSTRSPPHLDERERSTSGSVSVSVPSVGSVNSNSSERASLSPRLSRGRQSASTSSLPNIASGPTPTSVRTRGPGVTIDTSPAISFSMGGRGSGSPTSQASSHGFPSPVDTSPPMNIPMGGGLHRSTSGSNVRLLAGEDGLLSRAAGAVSRGFGALWGSPEPNAVISAERR